MKILLFQGKFTFDKGKLFHKFIFPFYLIRKIFGTVLKVQFVTKSTISFCSLFLWNISMITVSFCFELYFFFVKLHFIVDGKLSIEKYIELFSIILFRYYFFCCHTAIVDS